MKPLVCNSWRPATLGRAAPCILAAWVFACCGCGGTGTVAVSGTVTLDGAPLATGEIEFTPTEETGGPAAGAVIEGGRYEVPAVAQGLRIGGVYKVRIISLAGRGNFAKDPNAPGGQREALENIIPARYNENTELQITVSGDSSVHDFALSSN
ncbi:MAG: hypothetical protein DCC67_13160 [Planctomycetota bacterium]|nr:MAG: hypothetical protein DCC67_13160 [Planctomycetota bacterium]